VFEMVSMENLEHDSISLYPARHGRCEIVARELRQKGYDIEYLEGGIEA
jgi:rhodanese-related sulfurtransferase